eukprot:1370528-Amorphochlora_amoeboformis.AAC.1
MRYLAERRTERKREDDESLNRKMRQLERELFKEKMQRVRPGRARERESERKREREKESEREKEREREKRERERKRKKERKRERKRERERVIEPQGEERASRVKKCLRTIRRTKLSGWISGILNVRMINASVDYGYEYLGNAGRLVITQ